MYFNINDPFREVQKNINDTIRMSNKVATTPNLNINYSMNSVARAMTNFESLSNRFATDIRLSTNIIKSHLNLQTKAMNQLKEAFSIPKPILEIDNIKFYSNIDYSSMSPSIKFNDFRKGVLLNDTVKELNPYYEEEIDYAELSVLKEKIFNLEKRVVNQGDVINELKQDKLNTDFQTDINTMRIDDFEKKQTVAAVVGWFCFTLQFYGYDLNYETTKGLFESFVKYIKIIIDHS